jgi:hypothetical protein
MSESPEELQRELNRFHEYWVSLERRIHTLSK